MITGTMLRRWGVIAAVVTAGVIAPSQALASKNGPPRPASGKHSRNVPAAVAKRSRTRARQGRTLGRPTARAASIANFLLTWTTCNYSYMTERQPLMWGEGSDANWVSAQHSVSKLEGGIWRLKASGAPTYARALNTRTAPTTAWMYQNGAPAPYAWYESAGSAFGIGTYRMSVYLQWYDAANHPVRNANVWASHWDESQFPQTECFLHDPKLW
jgi:hypothetical protein